MISRIRLSQQTLHRSAVGKIIIPVATSDDHDRLVGMLSHLTGFDAIRTFESFEATEGALWRVLHDSGELFLVGVGAKPTPAVLYKVFRKLAQSQASLFDAETGLLVHPCAGMTATSISEYAVNGLLTGTYQLSQRAEVRKKPHPLQEVILLGIDGDNEDDDPESTAFAAEVAATRSADGSDTPLLRAAHRGRCIAGAQLLAMELINLPSNWKYPSIFAEKAAILAAESGLDCTIYDEKRLQEEGFGLLLGVNRGSEHPARFLVLSHQPDSVQGARHIVLVGKGVTFDSGGLSIKPSESMPFMKCDMGGAATVLAATLALAQLAATVQITAVIPLTENLIDARAIKPGDILSAYDGKTVEIIDTDAEGRLILADALAWVGKNLQADYVIDLATLTGATVRTFGAHAAALFSSDAKLEQILLSTGTLCGEKLWPLPLWDEYADDIRSDVADVRNFSGKPTAGAISAAKFLEAFTDKQTPWAHLDVAGTVFGDTEFGKQKNATGYGVRLLVMAVEALAT